MKNAKRWLSFILSAVMFLSFVACTSAVNSPATSPAQSTGGVSQQPTSEQPSTDPTTEQPTKDYSKKLTLEYANVAPLEGYDYTAGDAYAKYWSDKFNWELDIVSFTWENWNDQLRIWVNSQDMPEISVFQYNTTTAPDAASWAEQGLVKRLPDDWKQRWPNAAKVFDKTSLGPMTEELFGGTYFLPRARFDNNLPGDPLPNHHLVYIRKDWAEAVGFPIKDGYKASEILEYARLVKEKDPGGLGSNLVPIAATPDLAGRLFVNHNSTFWNTYYLDKDGSYKWGAASEDTLLGLKLMYQAYEEKLLHPEFYTFKQDQDRDMFCIAGNCAVIYLDGTATGMQMNMEARFGKSLGLDPKTHVHAATVLGEDGNFHLQDLINYWGTIIFSPNISDEKFERFMDALDYGCSDEGYMIQVAGFEGEDYKWEGDKMINLLPEGMPLESSEGKYPSIGGYMIANLKLWDDFMVNSPVVNPHWATRSWDMYKYKVKMGTPDTFPKVNWTVFNHDSPSRRQASYNYGNEYANLVSNAKSAADLESNWRAWVASQNSLIQPVLDELNAKR